MSISAKPSPTKCSRCKRPIKRIVSSKSISVICLACGLRGIVLHQAFTSLIKQQDMVEFSDTIKEWYPTYEDIQSG